MPCCPEGPWFTRVCHPEGAGLATEGSQTMILQRVFRIGLYLRERHLANSQDFSLDFYPLL